MTTPVAPPLRVLVVDDQAPFRTAIRRVLGHARTLDVIAEATDGAEAVRLTGELRPDIVLLDVRMPGMDGPTAARIIAERWPRVSVVLCSSHGREDLPEDLGAPFVAKELLTAKVLLAAAGRD
jgi:DNA-binding NarL/FixJ family response regulator